MEGDGSGRTGAVRLGLPDFTVLAAMEVAGEVELLVETTALVTGCPRCGVVAVPRGRRPVSVRDLPAAGRPVLLVWSKRLWRCPTEPRLCAQQTWSETSEQIPPRAVVTARAAHWAMVEVGRDGKSVAAVARQLGVGWHTVMRAVQKHGQSLVNDRGRLEGVFGLGVDEHVWAHAGPKRRTGYATGIVDAEPGTVTAATRRRARSYREGVRRTGSPPVTTTGATVCGWPCSTRSAGCQGACAAAASRVVTVPPGGVALALRSAGPFGVPASRSAGRVVGRRDRRWLERSLSG